VSLKQVELVDLIGVCFDGWGRPQGQAHAPAALREANLERALSGATVTPDITVSKPDPTRGPGGFVNEQALVAMVDAVHDRVQGSLHAQRFPLVYGADCAVLLGAIPALRDEYGAAGLLFIDAHEDATPMEASPDGEAASMEIALLLGLTGSNAPAPLRRRLPALQPEAIVLGGQRDEHSCEVLGIPSISDQVRLFSAKDMHRRLGDLTSMAVAHLEQQTRAWWVHVDLDVLRGEEFAACAAANDPAMPGGLTWTELTAVVAQALQNAKCRGLSIGVYNPDLDPNRQAARDIVRFLAHVTAGSAAGSAPNDPV